MLTVWTACTGDAYSLDEVIILKRQVDRHLKQPHIFRCITEHDIPGIGVKPVKYLPGWWIKTTLFGSEISRKRNLWLDLDVAITGSLDGLVVPLASGIRIAKNWAQSGWGGCQSSVMYWEGDSGRIINDEFDPAIAHWPPINKPGVLWGDQEWITQLRDEKRLAVEYFNPADVVSYKYHCRGVGLPEGVKVAVFHGKPGPCEVNDKWVMDARLE